MKKLIFISILSLVFMAAGAQRTSRSGSSDQRSDESKKSEMTVRRSSDQQSRSYDNRQNENNRSATYGTRSNTGDNNRSGNGITTERINNRRTDVHKNITQDKAITYESRRVNSTTGRSDNAYNNNKNEGQRKVYHTPNRTEYHRQVTNVNRPRSIEYRRVYYAYRAPVYTHVVWTNQMYREYRLIYPEYRYWYYPVGYRINTISAYDAGFYIGDVMNVYGRVNDVWYNSRTDEYFLHFGAPYPYHDFTVIIPGRKARHFAIHPEFFFENRYIWVTGLISLYDGNPEMMIRKTHQINLY
ncbi:MAG: hypothetical protein ISS19_06455 [Bacteroidales bacterium]|nr:hypothetical protein [Bacteroidales bacterium]